LIYVIKVKHTLAQKHMAKQKYGTKYLNIVNTTLTNIIKNDKYRK
jgi:hypothetical protein